MRARQLDEAALPGWSREAGALIPTTGSDSESLDAAVALLCANGLDLPLAMTRLVPPAWEKDPELTPDEAAFYECQAAVSEPWDGPASLAFSDGRVSGVRLDRNGFRPARFILTRDQHLLAGSETGLFDLDERDILKQGRLGPGQMIVVDREANTIQHGHEISRAFASARPYRLWVRRLVRHFAEETLALPALPAPAAGQSDQADQPRDLIIDQRLFGVDREEVELIIRSLAVDGKEAVGSMGDDTPPAALSQRPRLLSDFFRQRFAQVTNPPMDALREGSVMSLRVWLGPRGDITREDGGETQVLALDTPILTESGLARLYAQTEFPIVTLPLSFDAAAGPEGLRPAVEALAQQAVWEVEQGGRAAGVVRSRHDAGARADSGAARGRRGAPVADRSRLQAARQHRGRIRRCARCASGGDAAGKRRVGGDPVSRPAHGPRAASGGSRRRREEVSPRAGRRAAENLLEDGRVDAHGLLRRAAVRSARPRARTGAVVPGVSLRQRLDHLRARCQGRPRTPSPSLRDCTNRPIKHFGFHGFRRDGDYHAFNPEIIKKLHAAAGSNSAEAYDDFSTLVHGRAPMEVRDLLELNRTGRQPVPLDEVEPAEAICTRSSSLRRCRWARSDRKRIA